MKKILVATDFSPAATNAANYATDLAMALHADLFLLHVTNVPVSFSEISVVLTEGELIRDAEKRMQDLKEELSKQTKNKINIETEVSTGVFFQSLKETCDKLKPYAVVIGAQGKSAVERMFFGEHASYAMRHLTWPLIAVPSGLKYSLIKKIGLASDFDHVIETMPLEEIKTLVTDFHAELHVLNTGRKQIYDPEIVFQSGLLQEMFLALKPEYHFIASEDVDEGIIEFADQHHIDLLIVLPKRHSLIDRMVHTSHTKQFVMYSHIPVMALHQ